MKYCIVIPTYNRLENLTDSLKHNLRLLPSEITIIVVDASDHLFVPSEKNVKVTRAYQKGQFNQKLEGAYLAKQAGFEYVLFLDDDIYFEKDFHDKFSKKFKIIDNRIHAVSLQVKNAYHCRSFTNLVMNFTKRGGVLLESTYTSAMNGSGLPTQWAIGGAVLWQLTSFLEVKNTFRIEGKAFCEDIFASSFFGKAGFQYWDDCKVYEDDKSLGNLTNIQWMKLGISEVRSRTLLVERRPKLFKRRSLFFHAFWRAMIFLMYGIFTLNFKRVFYSFGNLIGIITCLSSVQVNV